MKKLRLIKPWHLRVVRQRVQALGLMPYQQQVSAENSIPRSADAGHPLRIPVKSGREGGPGDGRALFREYAPHSDGIFALSNNNER